ncbi:MAG: hypothetical protein EOO38_07765 [Cytophagaceae bacterium]|jgi:hypothetical protein|nr:MAG: hypothetical protein EOO38_07765 [Cytophagaceae bacterium]
MRIPSHYSAGVLALFALAMLAVGIPLYFWLRSVKLPRKQKYTTLLKERLNAPRQQGSVRVQPHIRRSTRRRRGR